MALTKLPKNAFGTGSVDASKIEDGTIQNVELAGSLTGTQLASTQDYSSKTVTLPNTSVTSDQLAGSIANAKLSNSTFTVRGTSRSLGDSFSIGVDVDWQSVITADGSTTTTASVNRGYMIDTTSFAHTINLPASASLGDTIAIKDYAGTFATNNLTIGRNGHNIQGVANNSLIDTNRASIVLVYVDSTKGWLYTDEHNVADLGKAAFTSATGGTITTSGDYKIHTFTGDGCFVVTAGNGPTNPLGGPNTVSYLVLAGGGGSHNAPASCGAAAGGGGGGFREGRDIAPSYTASPLVSPTGLTLTSGTYPVTVGAAGATGGGNQPNTSNNGSNSIFSTITSAGGGTGAGYGNPGGAGGSGGGGPQQSGGLPGGAGNTPPVSPSQGNPGGSGNPGSPQWGSGGGGGAGGPGGNAPPNLGGPAGGGVTTSISGSPVGYAGGGNGRGDSGDGTPAAPFGGATPSVAAAANRGGGGTRGQGAGSGVVIIRYKFQ